MRALPRGSFPTESRTVNGADDGGYRSHILAYCCKCGFEGALPCAKHCSTVPSEAGQQMFRHKGWKMAPNNRSRDVCPICAGKARIASAPEERRDEQKLRMVHDLLLVAQSDPNFLGQQKYANLLRDFPELTHEAEAVVREWAQQKRPDIADTFARVDAVVQAAITRMRDAGSLDAATLEEIDERVADIYGLMAESRELAALALEEQDAVEDAQTEDLPMHAKDTALGAAYIKAQTDKIKQAGALRPVREAPKPAAAEKIVAAAGPVESPPPTEPGKARRKSGGGGWAGLSPEEHAARVANAALKRNMAFAKKAGLTLEEWTVRNEARKAGMGVRKKAKAETAPKLRLVETPPAPKAAEPERATPVLIHDNTVNPTAAGVMDRIRISEALREHYVPTTSDGEGGYYRDDLSDARLAAMLGMPAAWVTERREVLLFGEDVNEQTSSTHEAVQSLLAEVGALKALQDKLFDDGALEVEAIEQRQAELLAKIQQDTKSLLDAAAAKVADAAAEIESRIVEFEQRVRALAGGR